MANDSDNKVAEIWSAARAYASSETPQAKKQLERAVNAVVGGDPVSPRVYVAKLTNASLNNQVWQGRSISNENDVMLFLDKTSSPQTVLDAVRGRLSPPAKSGFESIVIGSPRTDGGWSVDRVVEYEHSDIGEKLQQSLGVELQIDKVVDPAQASASASSSGLAAPNGTFFADVSSLGEINAANVLMHLREALNVALEGPPGTGKTHLALGVANLLAQGHPEDCRLGKICGDESIDAYEEALIAAPVVWELIQLHPSYSYDDFVRGLRPDPTVAGFTLRSVDGILPLMARVARMRAGRPTLLIIDEINRGDFSSILGEMLFAIDPAQRGQEIRLSLAAPAGGTNDLSVPDNLLLLATMNSADRSVGLLDYAVRRRFRFLWLKPSLQALNIFYDGFPKRAACTEALLTELSSAAPDPELAPGHSYLMVNNHNKISDHAWADLLIARLLYEVRPLFEEYREEGLEPKSLILVSSTSQVDIFGESSDIDVRSALRAWLLGSDETARLRSHG